MKNTHLILFSILFLSMISCNQSTLKTNEAGKGTEADVAAAVDQLYKGFTTADKTILDAMADEGLVYGHSGGKVQDKTEFINEVISKVPLVYVKINLLDQTIKMSGNTAVVRHIFTAETIKSDGTPGTLHVGNTLVFKLQDGKWKLICRQAYKID